MKSPVDLQSSVLGLVCIMCLAAFSASAQERQIRLRNQTIVTRPEPQARVASAADEAPRSGLHLVQFNATTKRDWIDQLEGRGAKIAKYVSDDAYVVRFEDVAESKLRSLPFVHWIGKYEAAYKVQERLVAFANGGDDATIELRAMLLENCPVDLLSEASDCVEGSKVRMVRGLGTILSGTATPAQVKALSESEAVLWIEASSKPKLLGELSAKIVAGDDGFTSTRTITQALGYTGSGVTVAVADSGLDQGTFDSVHPDLEGRVREFFAYGLSSAADGHGHGTHVAGIVAGNGSTGQASDEGYLHGLGVASEAEIIVQRIFDSAGGYTLEDDFHRLTRDAVRAGAEIGSNSWGDESNGEYDLSAAIFDALVRDADDQTAGDQPYILEFSAGNSGSGRQTINSPAVAKNVIATGASQNDWFDFFLYPNGPESMADFSSRGPAADGRIKPDVVAPGTWIASLQTSGGTSDNAWLPISTLYQYQGGTSQAGPQVSGAAAALVQYFREVRGVTPSPALTKAALINSAVNLDDSFGTKPTPNNDEGWGRVDLTSIIGSEREFDFVDQTELLTTGAEFEQQLLVGDPNQPLKVTMTYTDVPGMPFAIPALVNDLDLEVIDPDGRVFRGNQFNNGVSVPGAAGRDSINNVEGVLIERPTVGQYRVIVRAVNVVADARIDTPAVDQDFALFTTGELPLPGVGIVVLDRPAYTAPSEVNIRLVDFDLIDAESVSVQVTSDSDPLGETVLLSPLPALGAFGGSLPTSSDGPDQAGVLTIAHGDTIEVVYDDASPAQQIIATAEGDLVPPSVFGIRTSSRFGRSVIEWRTDEDARGSVAYGQSGTLDGAVEELIYSTDSSVAIEGLAEGETYQFAITAEDRAGNTTLDDNGGTFFSFQGPTAATVLIVDAFYENITLLGLTDIPPPPISTYTSALDQIGVSYELWSVEDRGSPTIEDLRPFRAVAWRFPEPSVTPPEFTNVEQDVIAEYLASDGSLLIASMDLFTRIEGTSFLRDVLQVKSFVTDPGAPNVRGIDREPISAGISMELDFSHYDLFGGFGGFSTADEPSLQFDDLFSFADWSDTFTPSTNAVPILTSTQDGGIVGARYPRNGLDVPGKLVLLSFPLDAIPATGAAPSNRAAFLANVMNFLVPGAEGTGTIEFDRSVYTIPSLVTINVADSDLEGGGSVAIRVFSDLVPQGIEVSLTETPREGEFQGICDFGRCGCCPERVGISRISFWRSMGELRRRVERIDTGDPRHHRSCTADHLECPDHSRLRPRADPLGNIGTIRFARPVRRVAVFQSRRLGTESQDIARTGNGRAGLRQDVPLSCIEP